MGPLGLPELIFILLLALLIFGPRKLPEIGRTLGKAMGEFRRATNDLKRTIDTEAALEEDRRGRAGSAAAPPAARDGADAPAGTPSPEDGAADAEEGDAAGGEDAAAGRPEASAEPAAETPPRGTEPR